MSVTVGSRDPSLAIRPVVDRGRVTLSALALVLGPALVAAMVAARPGPRNDLSYPALAPVGDALVAGACWTESVSR